MGVDLGSIFWNNKNIFQVAVWKIIFNISLPNIQLTQIWHENSFGWLGRWWFNGTEWVWDEWFLVLKNGVRLSYINFVLLPERHWPDRRKSLNFLMLVWLMQMNFLVCSCWFHPALFFANAWHQRQRHELKNRNSRGWNLQPWFLYTLIFKFHWLRHLIIASFSFSWKIFAHINSSQSYICWK